MGGPVINLETYARETEEILLDNILPFTERFCIDRERGGFYGEVGVDGTADLTALKGAVPHGRILWTYARAYRRYANPAYLRIAQHAYSFLQSRLLDRRFGGYYWAVGADGRSYQPSRDIAAYPRPLARGYHALKRRYGHRRFWPARQSATVIPAAADSHKITYVQSFSLFGLAEYHLATGDQQSLAAAITLFNLLQKHAYDPHAGGYYNFLRRDWQRYPQNPHEWEGNPDGKSHGTQIHILEAYTVLLQAWPDEQLRRCMRELIQLHINEMYDPESGHLGQEFDTEWHAVSETISFGHDIESTWLLVEAARALGDPQLLAETSDFAVCLAEATLRDGIDSNGAVMNNRYHNSDRVYWAQAEGMVGFLDAYELSGDARFLQASLDCWHFSRRHLVDRRYGGWLQYVTPDGRPLPSIKMGLWGGPYHQARACLEVQERARRLASAK